jgi:PAS domain S-box-containing protein
MLRRIASSWPLLVTAVFFAYSVVLLANAFHSQQIMRADAEQRIVADNKRRAAAVADLISERRHGAEMLAESPEVTNYLVNRSLGMSLRYGLNSNLYAIEELFRRQRERASHRGERIYSRIAFFDERGEVLVDLAREQGPLTFPPHMQGAFGLLVDPDAGYIVVSAPVIYKGVISGTVVSVGDLALLSRDMISSPLSGHYREVLLTDEGRELPMVEAQNHMGGRLSQALAALPENRLTSASELHDPLVDGSLAIRSAVPGARISLLTLLAEDEVYGQITSRVFLYAASLVPLIALVFALMFERIRRVGVALAQSEQRFRTIFDNIREAIFILDLVDGHVIEVNPSMLAMYGYSLDEVARLTPEVLGENAEPYGSAMWFAKMTATSKVGPQYFLWRARRKSGELFWVEISMLRTSLNGQERLLVVAHDVSQLKEQEQELVGALEYQRQLNKRLEEAQSQLLQAAKMASIGQLAAGVAHEINNPIGFVSSNVFTLESYLTQLFTLLDTYEQAMSHVSAQDINFIAVATVKEKIDFSFLKEDVFSLINESRGGLDRVKKIVQDLKDFSHIDQADWQLADLISGLESTLRVVWNEVKYKAEVRKEFAELPEIECLPGQINQVFMNLLVNAAQAIAEHGTITLRAGQDRDNVWVEVADTGQGIPAENLQRIFDPFFTTKPVGKGTGLGLSLSYGIIKKHHGRIEVTSRVGEGSNFRVWLPLRQPILEDGISQQA